MLALKQHSTSCIRPYANKKMILPRSALLVAGDFNAGKLKSILPHFYQHVKCATRGEKTLDHLYSTLRDAYKALPHPPFGKSDHNSILLIPTYKQKLKQEVPLTHSIRKWSDDYVDWTKSFLVSFNLSLCWTKLR